MPQNFIGKTGDAQIKKLGHTSNGLQGSDPFVRKQRGTNVREHGIKTNS